MSHTVLAEPLPRGRDAVHVDGGAGSGSGTIVRQAAALSVLTRRPVHVRNARARRPVPGLRPQHIAAVRACAELCGGTVQGLEVGSREFRLEPGPRLFGGTRVWDIGTAGSTTLMALAVLPIGALAPEGLFASITGGLFQDSAPSPFHVARAALPALASMGLEASLVMSRPGYLPGGGGRITLHVRALGGPMSPFVPPAHRRAERIDGIALASLLPGRGVSERMALACEERLASLGLPSHIYRVEDSTSLGPGAALTAWTCGTGIPFGSDRAGAIGRSAESIGRWVADRLIEDLSTDASVDRHLADMIVPFAAIASGVSRYRVPLVTDHLESSLHLVEQFGASTSLEGTLVTIHGIGRVPDLPAKTTVESERGESHVLR